MSERWPGGLISPTPNVPQTTPPYCGGIWTMDQVAYWKSQGQWPYGPYDPYYDYVTLLLNGDSAANAAQNNTFLDSSSNNFTITRNGNTTQGSFSPYGTLWSNYFVGTSGSGASSNYLTTPSSSVWAFGTGAFTLECWGYLTSAPDVSNGWNFFDFRTGTSLTVGWQNNQMYSYDGTNTITSSSVSSYLNTWTHWAWMRSGTTVYLFANGVVIGSGAMSTNFGTSASVCTINAKYSGVQTAAGFFSNARVSNIARYSTSGFTPATTNFTSDSNTLLLTMQNNRFIDNSPNAFTLTVNGTPKVQRFSPFNPTSPYSTATIGGSAYTDSSSDLSIAYNSALNFGSNDFTIEGWWYATSQPTNEAFWAQKGGSQYFILQPSVSGNNKIALYIDPLGASPAIQGTTTLVTGTWYHVALVRKTNVFTLYLNGVQEGGTYTNSGNPTPSSATTYINGQNYPVAAGWNGYVSNFRIVNGTAVYTGTFTPPTTPLTAITNTVLLTCQSNRFIDNSSNNFAITVNGTPKVQRFSPFNPTTPYSTATIGGSGYFDGSTAYLNTASSSAFGFGTGNFTFEAWVYATAFTNGGGESNIDNWIVATTNGSSPFCWLRVGANGSNQPVLEFYDGVSTQSTKSTTVLSTNTWYHVAAVRNGTSLVVYLNGTSTATNTNSSNFGSSASAEIGSQVGSSRYWNGYICDARVTNTAVYTSSFTPNTTPLTAISGTQLLCNMTNAGIPDLAMQNDLQTVGSAQVSTSVKKYGTGSLSFDGSSNLATINNGIFNVNGSFTLEMWVYVTGSSASAPFGIGGGAGSWSTTNGHLMLLATKNGSGNLGFQWNTSGSVSQISGSALSTNTWHWIVVGYNGTTTRLWLDGSSVGTSTNGYTNPSTNNLVKLGNNASLDQAFTGYIDDFRFTQGLDRYGVSNSTITPPSSALPTY